MDEMQGENKKEKKERTAKDVLMWIGLGSAFFLVLASGTVATAYGFEKAFQNRMFPGVSIGSFPVDGLTRAQARDRLQSFVAQSLEKGFRFRYGNDQVEIPTTLVGVSDPDVSLDVLSYDIEQAISQAYATGRNAGATTNALTRLGLLVRRTSLGLEPQINRPLVEKLLQEEVSARIVTAEDAKLEVSMASGTSAFNVRIIPEREGRMGQVGQAVDTLVAQAERLNFQPIVIPTATITPRITTKDLEALRPRIPAFLSHAEHTFLFEGKRFVVTTSTVAGWVSASPTESGVVLTLDPTRVAESVSAFVKSKLIEPKDGNLILDENDKFKELVTPEEGIVVDGDRTTSDVLAAWDIGTPTSTLYLKQVTPKITGKDAERLGITDLLGAGRSNFSGSPTNRRKNIAMGRTKMNGVLIEPGGTFSQLDTLGEIDGVHGWLPELVIKGDKTVPEYGGGLCQVGTTSFRAALASGLPIVERRAHSYRVRYYEPAGMDATIYDPAPDFKFKNDTPGYLLVTSQIQGDNLIFFVWGTKDGRVTSSTKPIVYNIVAAPPMKTIPTTDLPVGKKRCTESAHAGASAKFDYSVAYPDGTYKTETFSSSYRPWGAVCLVGATAEEVAAAANGTKIEQPLVP